MIDDCFMLHEDVLPGLGIPQKVVFLFYGVLVLIYLVKFREIILKTPFILLLFAPPPALPPPAKCFYVLRADECLCDVLC